MCLPLCCCNRCKKPDVTVYAPIEPNVNDAVSELIPQKNDSVSGTSQGRSWKQICTIASIAGGIVTAAATVSALAYQVLSGSIMNPEVFRNSTTILAPVISYAGPIGGIILGLSAVGFLACKIFKKKSSDHRESAVDASLTLTLPNTDDKKHV
jgi:hypothetical protein